MAGREEKSADRLPERSQRALARLKDPRERADTSRSTRVTMRQC